MKTSSAIVSLLFLSICPFINGGTSFFKDKSFYDVTDPVSNFQLFQDFIKEHKKVYDTEEEMNARLEIFIQNLDIINELNKQSETTVYGINQFSDLTLEEFIFKHTGYVHDPSYVPQNVIDMSDISLDDVPESFDWRDKKVVSEVKNQGHCGSCWAFSAIGGVESQYAIKYGKIVEFSEQQLVSCDNGSLGCHGGTPDQALENLIISGGVETEQDYPYESGKDDKEGECIFDKSKVKAVLKDHALIDFMKMSEDQIKAALYKQGPLSIALAGDPLHKYDKGIFDNCANHTLSHAVLLVGYGTENGVPYWSLKNSWGSNWGEEGYFRIKRGVNCLGFKEGGGACCTIT